MQEKLTILIPTKNRPDFLLRIIKYYKNTNFRGHLFIGDSSEGMNLERNKENIKKYNNSLQIYYCQFPDLNQSYVNSELVPQIETEFSSYLCDDDILITSSIDSCVKYLIDHEEVSGTNGKSILFEMKSGNAFGELLGLSAYPLAQTLDSSGQARLANVLYKNPNNMNFSILRTSNQKVVWEKVRKLPELHSVYKFEELIGSTVMGIRGKIVQLPFLFLCRQSHQNQAYHKFIDFFEWFKDKDWHVSYNLLEKTAIEELMFIDKMTKKEAEQNFKEIFWPYLVNAFKESWEGYNRTNKNDWVTTHVPKSNNSYDINKIFRNNAKKIPGARKIVLKTREFLNMLSNQNDNYSLTTFLNPSFSFHKDFMPLYDTITHTNELNKNRNS